MIPITCDRHLTPEEAAEYNTIREEIEAEEPEINVRIRQPLAERRKKKAAESDGQPLGQRIRTAFGESQVNLAAAAEISQGYLSQLETDERESILFIAARLANALRISLDELAAGTA